MTTEHDPLCPEPHFYTGPEWVCPMCAFLPKVRADERARLRAEVADMSAAEFYHGSLSQADVLAVFDAS